MLQWSIGDVRVTRVVELLPLVPAEHLLNGVTPQGLAAHRSWMYPSFIDDAGNFKMSIHAFIVESAGRRIIVDTCVGNDKERGYAGMSHRRGPFLEHLADAGAPAESIDAVLCTHLHFDHVGWNTVLVDGEWVPTFKNARYLFAKTEWEFWKKEFDRGAAPVVDSVNVMVDSVRPVIDAGLVDLVASDHQLTDEVWLEPSPGHTPGHVLVRISSGGHDAVITGDMMHNPIQIGEPTWGISADSDPAQAIATRQSFLERLGGTGTLVLGTHFPPPTAGLIVADDNGWRLDTVVAAEAVAR